MHSQTRLDSASLWSGIGLRSDEGTLGLVLDLNIDLICNLHGHVVCNFLYRSSVIRESEMKLGTRATSLKTSGNIKVLPEARQYFTRSGRKGLHLVRDM